MLTDERPDLFERLTALGEHLDTERRAAVRPRSIRTTTAAGNSDPSGQRDFNRTERRRPRVSVVLTAAVTVAVLIGGLFILAAREQPPAATDPPGPAALLPPDPPGPLFVLPSDLDRFPVRAGHVEVSDPDADWPSGTYQWAAIGTPATGGYDQVVGALSLGQDAEIEDLLALGDWSEIDTPTGTAHTQQIGPGSTALVVQERDHRWIRLMSTAYTDTQLAELLSSIELDEAGQISVSNSQQILFAQDDETAALQQSTGFSTAGADGDYWIETATGSNPLAFTGAVGDRVEPILVADRPGWLISRQTADGPIPYAVTWSATSHRIIAVGTNSDWQPDVEQLLAVAAQLRTVDESAWHSALPNATTETFQPS